MRMETKKKMSRPRGAFTLVEVMAASAIMVLLIGTVLYLVGQVLASWNDSAGKIQGYFEGDSLADFMQQDLQSMVVKRDGRAWLQVAYPKDVGMLTGTSVGSIPVRPPEIMFFSPTYVRPRFDSSQLMNRSTDRTPIAGSICAVKYQLSYKSPFKEGSSNEGANVKQFNAFYGLYRGVIDSKSTFEEALGDAQGDVDNNEYALQRFWNGTCSVLNDQGAYDKGADLKSWILSPENFIAPNVVDIQITFAIMYKKEGENVSEGQSPYHVAYIEPGTPFTVAEKIYVNGNLYERSSGGGRSNVSPSEVENGFLAFAELSVTFLSEAGVTEMRSMPADGKLQRFQELRQKYGTTTTRKFKFIVEPTE